MAKSEGPTIFDYMNQIYGKTSSLPYDKKIASPYMLSMWFAHDEGLLPIVDKLNSVLYNTPDERVYDYYVDKIPKGRRFIKWTKKVVDDKFDPSDLMMEQGFSKQEAMLYKRLMGGKK